VAHYKAIGLISELPGMHLDPPHKLWILGSYIAIATGEKRRLISLIQAVKQVLKLDANHEKAGRKLNKLLGKEQCFSVQKHVDSVTDSSARQRSIESGRAYLLEYANTPCTSSHDNRPDITRQDAVYYIFGIMKLDALE
jgi:hypothetical protein